MNYESVTQSHSMGCGVACVAHILDMTYEDALNLFSEPANALNIGYYCEDIIEAFNKVNKKYSYSEISNFNTNLLDKDNIIVFCPKTDQYQAGHYFAKKSILWMNPWINCPIINPALSGFVIELPIFPEWIIYPT
jgi:hypothetical protein